MKYALFISLFTCLLCCEFPKHPNDQIEVIDNFSDLESRWKNRDQVWVINFWATTCPPCIREIPHFRELQESNDHLKVLLVSLDRARELENRVYPFVKKYNITPEVVILEDQNYSAWTALVDPDWYGALPATLIISSEKRLLRFGAYETYEELAGDVNESSDGH